MSTQHIETRVRAVRGFNRFYTRQIGVLNEKLLDSKFSLTETRILYELANSPALTSTDLCKELGLNAGYLSRVISNFEAKGLITKTRTKADARAFELKLTKLGAKTFAPLDKASQEEVTTMLNQLSNPQQEELIGAMSQIKSLLDSEDEPLILRDPLPGDMGMVVSRQAMLYASEYGWNSEYEALTAEIVAQFIRDFDPAKERCWIAEKNGKMVGSVFVVRKDDKTAKLRLLYVDSSARGLGIGSRLVDECLRFAKRVGYKKMILWTTNAQTAARKLYDKAGFSLIEEEKIQMFGKNLTGQTFSKEL